MKRFLISVLNRSAACVFPHPTPKIKNKPPFGRSEAAKLLHPINYTFQPFQHVIKEIKNEI